MFVEERRNEILRLLSETGKVKTIELAELFGVSEPTIRRDISDLNKQELLIRTHGGALTAESNRGEPSFSEKVDKYAEEKTQIGKTAAAFITDGKTILLDAGTTTLQVAKHINAKNVTVITNSLDIAYELENKPEVEVILLGGTIRWNTRAMVGPITEVTMKRFRVDMLFVGTNAISIEGGITTPNLIESQTKKTMIDIARRTFVVTDHTKFDRVEFCQIASIKSIAGVITDHKIPQEIIEKYEDADIEIIVKEGDVIDIDNYPKSSD
ncbi:MAG: DeoR/GlpR family DNA-binding transcription regulator [Alkaliphilus sp.]